MPAAALRTLLLPFILAGAIAWSSGAAAIPSVTAERQAGALVEAAFKRELVKAYAQLLRDQAAQLQAGSSLYANQYEKWPATPEDLTPDWLLSVPTPTNIEVLALKTMEEFEAYGAKGVAATGKWGMLHDKAGNLVYIKLEGVSMTAKACSEIEARHNAPGSESGTPAPSAELDYQKFDQCAASDDGPDATLSYFSGNPESPSPEAACDALALYNAAHGTSYKCRPTPAGGPAVPGK